MEKKMSNENSRPNERQGLKQSVKRSLENFQCTEIDAILNSQFIDKTKFPDQCRDRFEPNLIKNQAGNLDGIWTQSEISILFANYKEIGSKWVEISKNIPGKSQNNVKNKFYGSMRKTIRCLNRKLNSIGKKKRKQIRMKSVLKIFQFAEGFFPAQHHSFLLKSQAVRNILLTKAERSTIVFQFDEIKQIADKINDLSLSMRSYKSPKKNYCHKKSSKSLGGSVGGTLNKFGSELNEKNDHKIANQYLQINGSIEKQNEKQFQQNLVQSQREEIQHYGPSSNEGPKDLMDFQNIFENEDFQKWDKMLIMQYNLSDLSDFQSE